MDFLQQAWIQIQESFKTDFLQGLCELLYSMVEALLSAIISFSYGTNHIEKVQRLLFLGTNNFTGSFTGFSNDSIFIGTYWDVVNILLDVTKSFGIPLIAAFFIIHILDISAKEQLSVDTLIKELIQLVLVIAVAGNIDVIVNTLLSFGDSLLYLVQSKIRGTIGSLYGSSPLQVDAIMGNLFADWADEEMNSFTDRFLGVSQLHAKLMRVCGVFFSTGLLWISAQIMVIAADIAALSRAIDVAWRIVFAPIAISNSFEGGVNSSGIRYLKGLAGAILSGVLIYVIVAIGFGLSISILSSQTGAELSTTLNIIIVIAANLATAGAVIGVPQKIKEVFQ